MGGTPDNLETDASTVIGWHENTVTFASTMGLTGHFAATTADALSKIAVENAWANRINES
jgi:hypothetical protein